MRGPKKRLTPFGKMVVKALADRDMSRAFAAVSALGQTDRTLLLHGLLEILQVV